MGERTDGPDRVSEKTDSDALAPDPDTAKNAMGVTSVPAFPPELELRALSKVGRRLLPLVACISFCLAMSRQHISIAAAALERDLGLSTVQISISMSSHTLVYAALQVPATALARRAGVRRSLAFMSLATGVIYMSTSCVRSFAALLACRITMGIVQAATVPTVTFLISRFYGKHGMSKAFMLSFTLGGSISNIFPGGALILYAFRNATRLHEWQYLFLIEGILPVVLSVPLLLTLPGTPMETKKFLDGDEHAAIVAKAEGMQETREVEWGDAGGRSGLLTLIGDARVLLMASIAFFSLTTFGGVFWFQPQLIEASSSSSSSTTSGEGSGALGIAALFNLIPSLIAMPMQFLYAWHSDKTGERLYHALGGTCVICASIVLMAVQLAYGSPLAVRLLTLGFVEAGVSCYFIPFIAAQSDLLPSAIAPSGFAFVNTASAAGFATGPVVTASLLESTGSFETPFVALACISLAPIVLIACLIRKSWTRRRVSAAVMASESDADVTA